LSGGIPFRPTLNFDPQPLADEVSDHKGE
jgi:hypothetical protein